VAQDDGHLVEGQAGRVPEQDDLAQAVGKIFEGVAHVGEGGGVGERVAVREGRDAGLAGGARPAGGQGLAWGARGAARAAAARGGQGASGVGGGGQDAAEDGLHDITGGGVPAVVAEQGGCEGDQSRAPAGPQLRGRGFVATDGEEEQVVVAAWVHGYWAWAGA